MQRSARCERPARQWRRPSRPATSPAPGVEQHRPFGLVLGRCSNQVGECSGPHRLELPRAPAVQQSRMPSRSAVAFPNRLGADSTPFLGWLTSWDLAGGVFDRRPLSDVIAPSSRRPSRLTNEANRLSFALRRTSTSSHDDCSVEPPKDPRTKVSTQPGQPQPSISALRCTPSERARGRCPRLHRCVEWNASIRSAEAGRHRDRDVPERCGYLSPLW